MALREFNLAVKNKMAFILCWRMLDKKNHNFNFISIPVQEKIIHLYCFIDVQLKRQVIATLGVVHKLRWQDSGFF